MYLHAVKDLPAAGAAFCREAWAHPGDTLKHVAGEVVSSVAFGTLVGAIVPAKGPAAGIVAGAFTLSLLYGAGKRLYEAGAESNKEGADREAIARKLADDTVSGGADFAINLGGGYLGTELGYGIAHSSTPLGESARFLQGKVIFGENESMLMARKGANLFRSAWSADTRTSALVDEIASTTPKGIAGLNFAGESSPEPSLIQRSAQATRTNAVSQPFSGLSRRIDQYSLVKESPTDGTPDGVQLFFGSTHGHSRYSDGLGLPKDLYDKAIAEGQQVTSITDHNHLAAREGVKPGDPRSTDEQGTPIIAASPDEYIDTQNAAAATTTPGKHVSLYGIEMGTIGGVGHTHGGGHGELGGEAGGGGGSTGEIAGTGTGTVDGAVAAGTESTATTGIGTARNAEPITLGSAPRSEGTIPPTFVENGETLTDSLEGAHLGGVNHINVLEVPTFFEAVRQPRPKPQGIFGNMMARLLGTSDAAAGELKAPDVVRYNDGDYASMVAHLDALKDSTGQDVIATLNHPRFLADNNPSLPDAQRGRDYGRKSFANDDEWRAKFVIPHVRGIELIKGGALNPNPVDTIPTGMIDVRSYTGYLGLGVEAGPLFGRDFHFGDPVGNPGSTGFLASSLDKPGILDALRQRRTIATTSHDNLSGYLMANDKFFMGSILDQKAVSDLSLKMKMGGNIDPNAQYQLKLFSDDKVLDGTDAAVIQTKSVTGQQILDADGVVAFDPVTHKLGNNSLYFVEADRVDATANRTDKMWTSPIWVRPMEIDSHGLLTRMSAGNLVNYEPWHQALSFPTH
jgi:hypothetical protein